MNTSHGAEETKVLIQERVRKTTERLEADFSKIETKIHRFPQGLREIGDRYIIPGFVALGPYHHGLSHLQEVEEIKDAAAHYFCTKSGHSVEEVYGKILSIVGEARGCYVNDEAVARFSDVEFAEMMFLDGCFLLQYIGYDFTNHPTPLLQNRILLSTGPCILRDIFLLENQLPWLVLRALMTFTSVDVFDFIVYMSRNFDANLISTTRISRHGFDTYKPPHLLGLLRYYQIGSMASEVESSSFPYAPASAIELVEIGVKLTASNKSWSADMSVQRGFSTCELSLTPLSLKDYTACWLVNMAAFEVCMSVSFPNDGYVVCSYLSLMAMLMDKEEDVQELRSKHLLQSSFSDKEMLHFFKGLARDVRLGFRYFVILERIGEYKRQRPVWIAIHKFLYKYSKTIIKAIATLLSIFGVLVGIFKTLLGLKQD